WRDPNSINGMMNMGNFQGSNQPPRVWDIWAHDETVEPGKIYRYKIRVTVRNPVYDTKNVVADEKLSQIPELPPEDKPEEGWSGWSSAVRIPSKLDFFVQSTTPGPTPQVKFSIFRWQNGRYNQVITTNLQPGDMVGKN